MGWGGGGGGSQTGGGIFVSAGERGNKGLTTWSVIFFSGPRI